MSTYAAQTGSGQPDQSTRYTLLFETPDSPDSHYFCGSSAATTGGGAGEASAEVERAAVLESDDEPDTASSSALCSARKRPNLDIWYKRSLVPARQTTLSTLLKNSEILSSTLKGT